MTSSVTDQAVAHHQGGRLAEAVRLYRAALAGDPRNFTARHLLGVALAQSGDPQAGLAEIESALLQRPDDIEAHLNRANVLRMLGRLPAALDGFSRALAARPDWADILSNRGGVLQDLRRLPEALADFDRAAALAPRDSRIHNNRGGLLLDMQRPRDALAAFEQALALAPDDAVVLNNRGNALRLMGQYQAAIDSYDRALALKPDYGHAYSNRAGAYQMRKQHAQALADYEMALRLDPDNGIAFGGAAMAALNMCDWARAADYARQMPARVAAGQMQPWALLGYSGDEALQKRCAETAIALRFPAPTAPRPAPYRHDRLRLAYISSDFGRHPVTSQLVQVLECHDRAGFMVHGIATTGDDGSPQRQRIAAACDHFHDMTGLGPDAVAGLVRELEIDILIDLNGHTEGDQFDVLARRPAPLQVCWLGYAGTSGAPFVDACIADVIVAPEPHAFTEKLVYLPYSFFPHDAGRIIGPAPARAEMGLPETGFVFCCFNQNWKYTADVFALWLRLLAQVPGSVLWLRDPGAARPALLAAADAAGIDPARLVFAAHAPSDADHLGRHACADLFLDTLPYNAHATAADALFAGLPVLTQRGISFCGRVGASLLAAVRMPELITETAADYEALALALARDPARLAALRAKLAAARYTAPLFDTPRFTRDLEAQYRRLTT